MEQTIRRVSDDRHVDHGASLREREVLTEVRPLTVELLDAELHEERPRYVAMKRAARHVQPFDHGVQNRHLDSQEPGPDVPSEVTFLGGCRAERDLIVGWWEVDVDLAVPLLSIDPSNH